MGATEGYALGFVVGHGLLHDPLATAPRTPAVLLLIAAIDFDGFCAHVYPSLCGHPSQMLVGYDDSDIVRASWENKFFIRPLDVNREPPRANVPTVSSPVR